MNSKPLRVGLIGYGAVGQEFVRLVAERASNEITLVGTLVNHSSRPHPLGVSILTQREALLAKQPHVVVEAAGHEGIREHGAAVLRAGVDLLIISVGALAEPALMDALIDAAQKGHAQARIVSGAIGALDALAAASISGELSKVVYTMRKPPTELLSFEEASKLIEEQIVFRGNARQAALQFSDFLNVVAAVALAGRGFEETEVLVLADPTQSRTQHEFYVEGSFGHFSFEIENAPIRSVGRSAQLVALSILHSLLLRQSPLLIG